MRIMYLMMKMSGVEINVLEYIYIYILLDVKQKQKKKVVKKVESSEEEQQDMSDRKATKSKLVQKYYGVEKE